MKKKLLLFLIVSVLIVSSIALVACGGPTNTPTTITIATPDGAPAISLSNIFANGLGIDGYKAEINIVAPDQIRAQVLGEKADIVVMPSDAAYNLYTQALSVDNKELYKMIGTATYGNLYIVGGETAEVKTSIHDLKGKIIYSIGETSVPGVMLKTLLGADFKKITNESEAVSDKVNVLYVGKGPEAIGKLKKDTTQYALLGEPAVTASVGKAKTKVMFDMQELYKESANRTDYGFPQAVIVAKKSLIDSNPALVKQIFESIQASENYIKDNATKVPELLQANKGAAFPVKAIAKSNIKILSVKDSKAAVKDLFTFIGKTDIDDSFFYEFK